MSSTNFMVPDASDAIDAGRNESYNMIETKCSASSPTRRLSPKLTTVSLAQCCLGVPRQLVVPKCKERVPRRYNTRVERATVVASKKTSTCRMKYTTCCNSTSPRRRALWTEFGVSVYICSSWFASFHNFKHNARSADRR